MATSRAAAAILDRRTTDRPASLTWGAPPLWWPRYVRVALLLLTDLVALFCAAFLGDLLWAGLMLHPSAALSATLLPFLVLLPLGYAVFQLYPGFGLGAVETLRRCAFCTSFAYLALIATSFLFTMPPHASRIMFVLAWGISLVSVPLLRFFVLSVAKRWPWWAEPVVLVGAGPWVTRTILSLQSAVSLGYKSVGIFSPRSHVSEPTIAGVPLLGRPELAPAMSKRGVRVVFVGGDNVGEALLSWLQQYFPYVVVIRDHDGSLVERVRTCNLGSVLGVEFSNDLLRWQSRLFKRALDVVLGLLILVVTAPVVTVAGLLVRLASSGPIFFRQEREGENGRPITIWKLRTMYVDADKRLVQVLSENPELRAEWDRGCKLRHDPRVIPGVGAALRRWSIDELPQIVNVLKGEMSLVGPRPFPAYHLERFPAAFRTLRNRVRPGLTGQWQVMARSEAGIEEQETYDTYYIRNWSLWFDLYILARTVLVVITGRGAS